MQLVLAGEDCRQDSLFQWLQATNVVQARAHVCYNHLRLRRRIDAVLGGREVGFDEPLPEYATLQSLLAGLETELVDGMTKLSADALEAERHAHVESCDIANVRAQGVDRHKESPIVTSVGVWPTELRGSEARRRDLMGVLLAHPVHAYSEGKSVWYRDAMDNVVAATVRTHEPPSLRGPRRHSYLIDTEAGECLEVYADELRPWSTMAPTVEQWDQLEVFLPPGDVGAPRNAGQDGAVAMDSAGAVAADHNETGDPMDDGESVGSMGDADVSDVERSGRPPPTVGSCGRTGAGCPLVMHVRVWPSPVLLRSPTVRVWCRPPRPKLTEGHRRWRRAVRGSAPLGKVLMRWTSRPPLCTTWSTSRGAAECTTSSWTPTSCPGCLLAVCGCVPTTSALGVRSRRRQQHGQRRVHSTRPASLRRLPANDRTGWWLEVEIPCPSLTATVCT